VDGPHRTSRTAFVGLRKQHISWNDIQTRKDALQTIKRLFQGCSARKIPKKTGKISKFSLFGRKRETSGVFGTNPGKMTIFVVKPRYFES